MTLQNLVPISKWSKCRLRYQLFVLIALLCAFCSPAEERVSAPAPTPVTLSHLENHLAGDDPWEPFGRSMFAVTSFLMDYVARPVDKVYCTLVPRPVIEAISNVCDNLEYPANLLSCLLRAHWQGAGDETARFFINSTLGLGGLFDPAAELFYIFPTGTDFGQTFAAWGIAPGDTLVLPASGYTNWRDNIGLIFDYAFDIKTYIPYSSAVTVFNASTIGHRAFRQVVDGSNDRYKSFREMTTLFRQLQLKMWYYNSMNQMLKDYKAGKVAVLHPTPEVKKPDWMRGKWMPLEEYGPGDAVQDSLRILLFKAQEEENYWYLPQSYFDNSFSNRREERGLKLAPDRPEFVYSFWRAPENKNKPEKLAVLLPGIGGTASGGTPTAYAELLNRNGYSVLVIDSTFTWQFVVSRAGCRLPGYLPSDADAVRKIIRLALDDLKKEKIINSPELVLTGYSFGGMHTLKIAELETLSPQIGFKKYLAINPPASLRYAIDRADFMAQAMNRFTPREVVEKAIGEAGNIMASMSQTLEPYHTKLPENKKAAYRLRTAPEMARFMAGLYLRASMRSMLYSAHVERGLIPLAKTPAAFRRNGLYLELDKITFSDYASKYLLSEYPGVKLETLYARSDLRSLRGTLERNQKVAILHAENDFLLSPEDKKFLDGVLGERITWTSRGGHLGQLYYQKVQDEILRRLK